MNGPLGVASAQQPRGQIQVDWQARGGDYPHSRPQVLHALAGARPSMDVFAMNVKLAMHKYQVVRGIELALINHQQDMTNKVIASMSK